MHKVSRTLLLAGVMAFGTLTAACGDRVTVAPPTTGVTGVQSIVVTPSSATLAAGGSLQLAVSVVADAATPKTVIWSVSGLTGVTVDQTGKVSVAATTLSGVASVVAKATADTTKAAASVITVTGTSVTPAAIAISAVNQGANNIGNPVGVPANLAGAGGQLDVVLFASGPSGVINLIQNCGTDVIVAQQNFAGSQNQTPVTLSFNTAATGTVTGGIAVVNATASTPIFLNGACTIKATLTSGTTTLASAANSIPLTLANLSFFRTVMTNTGGSQISAVNGLNYLSGDLTFTLTPVNFVSATPLASISGSFGSLPARTFTNVAPATGTQTFTVTLPSAIVTSGTIPAGSVSNYTTLAAGGDVLSVTGSVTTGGATGFTQATAFGPIRVDNGAPTAQAVTVANPTGAQINNITNWVNATYSFASGVIAPVDSGATANNAGVNTVTTVIGFAASTVTSLTGNALYGVAALSGIGATQCSQTGWTIVANPAAIPQSAPGVSTTYRARAFYTDKSGNVRCQDLSGAPLAANANGFFGVDLQVPTLTKTGGPATNTVILTGATDTFAFQDSVSGFVLNRQVQYSLNRGFLAATAANATSPGCAAINDLVNPVATGNTASLCAVTTNSAPSIVIDNNSGTQAYYSLTAKSVDQAGNFSAVQSFVNLLDGTAPLVQGISIPQNLVGGTSTTFTSTATDNVDLASTNFNITYTAAAGTPTLFYPGNSYGTKFTAANVVTSAAVTATVPFFIQQVQGTAATACPAGTAAGVVCGAPVAFTAVDSGEATAIAVRAVDAANNVSAASTAAIPNINISGAAGFTTGTQFDNFAESNAAVTLSNGTGTGTRSVTLSASAILVSGTPQNAPLPFSQVCFYYQANAGDPTIPTGSLVQIGCITAPSITDVALVSRTWTYQLTGFDPPAALGTAGTLPVFAVGIRSNGVGVLSPANNNITLAP